MPNANREADLFGADHLPEGFSYAASLLDQAEEQALLAEIRALPFRDFEFHGFVGKRRVVSFGWRYDFNGGGLSKTEDMPDFLLPVREQAATFAKIPPQDLQQVLVTEYGAGAAIGWHRDRSVFGDVVGISLLSSCTSGSGANREPDGSARTLLWSPALSICCVGRPGLNGSIVSRPLARSAIRSRSATCWTGADGGALLDHSEAASTHAGYPHGCSF